MRSVAKGCCAQLLMAMAAHASADDILVGGKEYETQVGRFLSDSRWMSMQKAEMKKVEKNGLILAPAAHGAYAVQAEALGTGAPLPSGKHDDFMGRVLTGIDRSWAKVEEPGGVDVPSMAGAAMKFGNKESGIVIRPRARSLSIEWMKSF